MKRLDPYAELGLEKDATDAQIKAAGREAYKRTHPDRGGDVDAFQRARRSELALLDPVQRKKFDTTGDLDDDRPDNSRAAAIQVIESFMGPLIAAYINSGFEPDKDPRQRNLFEEFKIKINGEIVGLTAQIGDMEQAIRFLKDLASRFETDDPGTPIERSIEFQIRNVETSIETNKRGIEMRKIALEIADKYRFRSAPPPAPDWTTANLGTGFHQWPG